jgi:quaternary ammonium compound-resistance protein SugE
MPWLILVVAGLLEVAWAIGLKSTHGFTRPLPSILTIAAIALSMYLLAVAARSLPIGTAYAVWVGIGAAGTALMGVWLLGEGMPLPRLGFLVLLVVSIIGLKLTAPTPGPPSPPASPASLTPTAPPAPPASASSPGAAAP